MLICNYKVLCYMGNANRKKTNSASREQPTRILRHDSLRTKPKQQVLEVVFLGLCMIHASFSYTPLLSSRTLPRNNRFHFPHRINTAARLHPNRKSPASESHIIHPPFLELPTSLAPSLTLLFSPPPVPPIRVDQDSTIHSYHTFLLSVARNIETVSVDASGM